MIPFTLPSPSYIFGALLFSLIGWIIYRMGRKAKDGVQTILGVVLMLYTYLIPDLTWLMYLSGTGLTILAYVLKKRLF